MTINSDFVLSYSDKYQTYSCTLGDLGLAPEVGLPDTFAYVLRQGFIPSITDAAAYAKEDKAKWTDAELEANTRADRLEKLAGIIAGTIASGARGPRLSALEIEIRNVAEARMIAKAAQVKKTLPGKSTKEFTALRDKVIAANLDAFTKAAEKNLAAAAKAAESIDFDL